MDLITGRILKSKLYGDGVITREEDGLIWVDFNGAKKYNVCFQATSSFIGENPFLSSDDSLVWDYIQRRIELEKNVKLKMQATEYMNKLKISRKYIDAYINRNQVYIFGGDNICEVTQENNRNIYEHVKWYEEKFKDKVYAILPIPNTFANSVFTYAFLKQSQEIDIKGNIAFTFAYYLNPNCEKCGETRPLGIQITDRGIWAFPDQFSGFIWNLFEK